MSRSILASLIVLSCYACAKDQQAIIPTFVSVPAVKVQVNPGQGSDRHTISEIWAYADSALLGAFAVGSTFPIIADEPLILDVFAGIRENGQALDPRIYPFLSLFQVELDPNPGETLTIAPTFQYHPSSTFRLVEDFERSQVFDQDLDGDQDTFLALIEEGIEGRSASGVVSQAHPVLEVASNEILRDLPTSIGNTFLEMEYVSDVPIQVGLRGHAPGISPAKNYKLVLFPTEEPTKIYINFGPDLQASKLVGYQVIFLATFDVNLGPLEQRIGLDNIKLLHF